MAGDQEQSHSTLIFSTLDSFSNIYNSFTQVWRVKNEYYELKEKGGKDSETTRAAKQKLEEEKKRLKEKSPLLWPLFIFQEGFNHYVEPFKSIAIALNSFIIASTLFVVALVVLTLHAIRFTFSKLSTIPYHALNILSLDHIENKNKKINENLPSEQKNENPKNFKAVLLGIKKFFTTLTPAKQKDLPQWKKWLYGLSWPFRLIAGIPLLLFYLSAKLVDWLGAGIQWIVLITAITFYTALAFVSNVPRYLFTPPLSYFTYGLLLAGVGAALAFATFGIASIILGVAAGIGFLSGIVFDILTRHNKNPYLQFAFTALLVLGVAALVFFTFGTGAPFLAAILPFALPQTLPFQLLAVGAASLLVTTLPYLINLGLTKLGRWCCEERHEKIENENKNSKEEKKEINEIIESENKELSSNITIQKHKEFFISHKSDYSYCIILRTTKNLVRIATEIRNKNIISEALISEPTTFHKVKSNDEKKWYVKGNNDNILYFKKYIHKSERRTHCTGIQKPEKIYLLENIDPNAVPQGYQLAAQNKTI